MLEHVSTSPTFNTAPELRFSAPGAGAFEVDREARTIKGLAVPYGVPGQSKGQWYRFSKGTLKWADPSRVKLWVNHDPSTAIGFASSLEDTDEGLLVEFKIARGEKGDEALTMAEDRVWDGLSVGIADGGEFSEAQDGVYDAVSAPLMEISLTPAPSFDDARVHSVAASAATTTPKGTTMNDQNPTTPAPAGPVDFSAIGQAVVAAMNPTAPAAPAVPAREVVPAAPATQVTEGPVYRFDGIGGKHDFSTDLINGLKFGDGEAMARVTDFMATAMTGPRFAIDSGDVATLNPAKHRPDMYVDQLEYDTPLYDSLYKGSLTDATPFIVPKFEASAGLVADHVEGVEPTAGSFSATSQTITPKAVSGKAEIPREVIDAGGNPQVSALIWNQIVRAWNEKLEAEAATLLSSQVYDAAHTIALVGTDEALVGSFKAKLAALRFIRGGNRFKVSAMHEELYTALIGAQDAAGRSLLPIISPQNADGTTADGLEYVQVGGIKGIPSWALEDLATPASFMANPEDAHVWNSAPNRLNFEYRVAFVDLAVWGYVAKAVTRIDGLRKVTYAAA